MEAVETRCLGRDSIPLATRPMWRALLAGVLAGAFLASLGPAAIPAARGLVGTAAGFEKFTGRQQPASSAAAWPRQPLPREWRWSPPGVDVDRMFRQRH